MFRSVMPPMPPMPPTRWLKYLVLTGMLAAVVVLGTAWNTTLAAAEPAAESVAAESVAVAAQTGQIEPGVMIAPPTSATAFNSSKEQIANLERLMALKSKHLAPALGPHTSSTDASATGGPQAQIGAGLAPVSFTYFRHALITGGSQSSINEPSAAANGKIVVETSNWDIAYSTTANLSPPTWAHQNPNAISPGFCCDQQVIYDVNRNIYIMLILDYAGEGASTNGFTISIAPGNAPTAWCTYKFTGANFGLGATDTLDFPKLAATNSNLLVTWNDYPPHAGFRSSGLARMPLDSLMSCAGFGYGFFNRTTEFTFALASAPSSHDKAYWVSNWFLDGTTSGSHMRIFRWDDNSGTYFFNTIGINPYTFGNVSCGSPNWCSRLDPRYESVVITPAEFRAQANANFKGDQILEVASSAGPSGFSNGKNYVVYNYFKLNSLAYLGNDQTYSPVTNFAYPGCAVNAEGYVGCSMAQGTNVPGALYVLQDNVSPTQPWGYAFDQTGVGGASAWGDYIVTYPWYPSRGPFQTVQWGINATGGVNKFWVVFGRGRDTKGYARWGGQ